MTQRRLPAGFNTADENDIIQKGPGGLWYSRGPGEIVLPNIVINVDATDYAAPARFGALATIEVDSSGEHEITLCSAPNAGDIVRVLNAGIGTLRVLPGGAATIDGQSQFAMMAPNSMASFYRRTDGHWSVLSQGLNGHATEGTQGSPTTLPNGIAQHHTVVVDTTSFGWPATGGTVVLPSSPTRGTIVTVCCGDVNSARKEINVDAGSDSINDSTGVVCFNSPHGSVTMAKGNIGWQIINSTAKYFLGVTGALTLPVPEFWNVVPLYVLVQSGFATNTTISIPAGAHMGAELNVANTGGVPSNNIELAAVGGLIANYAALPITHNHGGGVNASITLRKVSEANNNWVITAQGSTI
jgi:hypothetical protein